MYYSSFIPRIFLSFYNFYYKLFVRNKKENFFAIGLIGTGIFHNEPIYSNLSQMKRDKQFFKKIGLTNIVVFRVGAILERGKDWLDVALED